MLATFQVKVVIVKCKSVKVKKWVQPVKGRLRHLLKSRAKRRESAHPNSRYKIGSFTCVVIGDFKIITVYGNCCRNCCRSSC